MRILTDFKQFPEKWSSQNMSGNTIRCSNGVLRFFQESLRADIVLINGNLKLVMWMVFLFQIMPFFKKPIIAVDLVLRSPGNFKQRVATRIKKLFFKKVDCFINYFRNLHDYERLYGIGQKNSLYVQFKGNIWNETGPSDSAGKFVVAAGKSLRDFDTFMDAIEGLPYPAAITRPDMASLRCNGARMTRATENFPENLTLLDDDGTKASWIHLLQQAKILVIPTLKTSLCASGISTYLDGMLLRKCIIISEGPGVSDVLNDEVIIVPPEDSKSLRDAIVQAWENDELREKKAFAGYKLALSAGGEAELFSRILDAVDQWRITRE